MPSWYVHMLSCAECCCCCVLCQLFDAWPQAARLAGTRGQGGGSAYAVRYPASGHTNSTLVRSKGSDSASPDLIPQFQQEDACMAARLAGTRSAAREGGCVRQLFYQPAVAAEEPLIASERIKYEASCRAQVNDSLWSCKITCGANSPKKLTHV